MVRKRKAKNGFSKVVNGKGGAGGAAVIVRQGGDGSQSSGREATTITLDQLIANRANRDNGGGDRSGKPQGRSNNTSGSGINNSSAASGNDNGNASVTIEQVHEVVNAAIAESNLATQNTIENNQQTNQLSLNEIRNLLVGLGEQINNNSTTQEPVVEEPPSAGENATTQATEVSNDSTVTTEANTTSVTNEGDPPVTTSATTPQESPPESQIVTAADERIRQLEQNLEAVQGVFSLYGMSAPNLNLSTHPLKEAQGKIQTLMDMYRDIPVYRHQDSKTKTWANQRDLTEFQRQISIWYQEAVNSGAASMNQLSLYQDLEKSMKNSGYLSGTVVTNAAGPTVGTPGSIGAFYLEVLASFMRLTHNQSNIFWQFPIQVYDPSTKPNLTMAIPRFKNLPPVVDPNDFLLATPDTFFPTPVVIGTNTDSQGLEAGTVTIGISEYGLGKNVSIGTRAVFISEFHSETSLLPLLRAVDTRLMQNYFSFEELLIRLQYEACSIIAYNKKSEVTFTPGDVQSGDNGTMTTSFAASLYTALFELQVPALNDGCYFMVLAPKAANQFKASLGDIFRAVTPEQRMDISNILKAATGVEIGRVNSYFGKYEGFHIFVGNSFGTGLPGSTPTVNTTSFGAGAFTTVESFVFGVGTTGRGIALAPELRESGVNPYNRGASWIWLSRENVTQMDMDSNLDPEQQTRCFKVRTSVSVL